MNPQQSQKKLVRVRPEENFTTKRNLSYSPGIMRVYRPSGSGKVDNLFGEGLKESVVTEKGDFLFIPPGVPHQPINLSDTEPAMAIVSRNIASEQEPVVLYDPQA